MADIYVHVVKVNGLHSTSDSDNDHGTVCTLTGYQWHQKEQHHAFDTQVQNGLVAVKTSCHTIAHDHKLRVAIKEN